MNNIVVAIGTAVLTASAILAFQKTKKSSKLSRLREQFESEEYVNSSSATNLDSFKQVSLSPSSTQPDELIQEQLTRNESFFGSDNLEKIKNSFVVVVGLGGVGSHAAVHLLRSGVMHLRLIDFDQVTLSSLNRHGAAVRSDVGTPKAEALKRHLLSIFPRANIEINVELFTWEKANLLLAGNPDYVLDCIDNIETKIDLLRYCYQNGIKVMSSMGSACKADPSRVQIADISATTEDKLAKAVRYKLKKHGINGGIPVVYSTERPQVKILPLQEEASENPDEFAALPSFRVRILPVLGALPAIFGSAMASYVLCQLGNFKMDPLPIKNRHAYNSRIYSTLSNKQMSTYNAIDEENGDVMPGMRITLNDANLLIDEIWMGKSVISGKTDHLVLSRWEMDRPTRLDNLVLMTKEESDKHETITDYAEEYGNEVVSFVSSKFKQLKSYEKL